MQFLNIHLVSESGFLQGIFFREGSIVMQFSFVVLILVLFLNQILTGGGAAKVTEGGANCLNL